MTDDGSTDGSLEVAQGLGLNAFGHSPNRGYGGNLKEGIKHALALDADYIVEIHGDGAQFDPTAVVLAFDHMRNDADLILGSRFQDSRKALANGMPLIRFVANRSLSFFDRLVLKLALSEFHSGFRIYSRRLLEQVSYQEDSNDYLFSFEIIAQAAYWKLTVAEIPVEADYNSDHTSIRLSRAAVYAFQTFRVLFNYILAKWGLRFTSVFPKIQ